MQRKTVVENGKTKGKILVTGAGGYIGTTLVPMTEVELAGAIDKALAQGTFDTGEFCSHAPEPFLQKIRQFLVQ